MGTEAEKIICDSTIYDGYVCCNHARLVKIGSNVYYSVRVTTLRQSQTWYLSSAVYLEVKENMILHAMIGYVWAQQKE